MNGTHNGPNPDAIVWSELVKSQDDFVATILFEKDELKGELRRLKEENESLRTAKEDAELNFSPQSEVNREELVDPMREYVEGMEAEMERLQMQHQEDSLHINALTRRVQRSDTSSPALPNPNPAPAGQSDVAGVKPYILFLIDGTAAPFSDSLVEQGKAGGKLAAAQIQWECEKDIRAFEVDFEGSDDQDAPRILTYVFYNRKYLTDSLVKGRVITSAATFDSYADGLNGSNDVAYVDIGTCNKPVDKIAALVCTLGPSRALKRLYFAGVNPAALQSAASGLVDAQSALSRYTKHKVVIINTRESDDDRDELKRLSRKEWRIAVFARFFSPNSGNGADWGFDSSAPNPVPKADLSSSDDVPFVRPGNRGSRGGRDTGSQRGKSGVRKVDISKDLLGQVPQLCAAHYIYPAGCINKKCKRSHECEYLVRTLVRSGRKTRARLPDVLSSHEVARLKGEVKRTRCKELVETGGCTAEDRIGRKCMWSHDPQTQKRVVRPI